MGMYRIALQAQTGEITPEESKSTIHEIVSSMNKYVVKSSDCCYYSYNVIDDGTVEGGFVNIMFCQKYRLEDEDAVVACTMRGIRNFFTNQLDQANNQIIVGASSVQVDDDMADANYDPNTGIFVYNITKRL